MMGTHQIQHSGILTQRHCPWSAGNYQAAEGPACDLVDHYVSLYPYATPSLNHPVPLARCGRALDTGATEQVYGRQCFDLLEPFA
jgi:hypothetical protein